METEIEVVKYGGSLFVRLPPEYVEKLKAEAGKKVLLTSVTGGILLH